jgi:hypothetical protein
MAMVLVAGVKELFLKGNVLVADVKVLLLKSNL